MDIEETTKHLSEMNSTVEDLMDALNKERLEKEKLQKELDNKERKIHEKDKEIERLKAASKSNLEADGPSEVSMGKRIKKKVEFEENSDD